MTEQEKKIISIKLLKVIDLDNLVSEYVNLQKTSTGYIGFSPFKNERTPSFKTYTKDGKKYFKDYSNGYGGNAIKFYRLINNLNKDIDEEIALKQLCEKYNVKIENKDYKFEKEKYKIEDLYTDLSHKKLLHKKNDEYEHKEVIQFLDDRGINIEDIKRLKLGIPADINKVCETFNIDKKEMFKLGLISENGNQYFFQNRILIPIMNENGTTLGFSSRGYEKEDKIKYLHLKKTEKFNVKDNLFLFDSSDVRKSNIVVLSEGMFDAYALHKIGIENACCMFGTSLTNEQLKKIKSNTKNVVLMLDGDRAGIEATKKLTKQLINERMNVIVTKIPDGLDPDECLRTMKKQEFFNYVKENNCGFVDLIFEDFKTPETIIQLNNFFHDTENLFKELDKLPKMYKLVILKELEQKHNIEDDMLSEIFFDKDTREKLEEKIKENDIKIYSNLKEMKEDILKEKEENKINNLKVEEKEILKEETEKDIKDDIPSDDKPKTGYGPAL